MLRFKLTLWYAGAMATVLLAFSLGFYLLFAQSLRQRLDGSLRSAAQVTALALNHETEEHRGKSAGEENVRLVLNTMHQTSFPRPDISVWDGDALVAEKPGLAGLPAERIRARLPRHGPEPTSFLTLDVPGGRYRVISEKVWVSASNTTYTIVASETTEPVDSELITVIEILAITVPISLLCAAAGGYFLARRSLIPVLDMARTAEQISSHNLSRRLPVGNSKDELGLLAHTFNRLFERLDDAFSQQRQFMADASHELRTPISVALTASQVSLDTRASTFEGVEETLKVIQDQMLRLRRVVEDMFTLAQADSGSYRLEVSRFYLDEVVVESVRAGRVLGNAKGVGVALNDGISEAPFTGDEGLVRQLLLILIDNAVKYTAAGGRVEVALHRLNDQYRLEVRDTGCGIPLEEQKHIFDRFYRVDKSRSRRNLGAGSGAGLGLSIARWIVGLHDGQIFLDRSTPEGSTFVIILPVTGPLSVVEGSALKQGDAGGNRETAEVH